MAIVLREPSHPAHPPRPSFPSADRAATLAEAVGQQIAHDHWPGYVHGYPHKRAYRTLPEELRVTELWRGYSKPLNLYVHVPFCTMKCAYCNLFRMTISKKTVADHLEAYCRALIGQIRTFGALAGGARIQSLYFGGGTPNLFSPSQLGRVTAALRESFPSASEDLAPCIECSPEILSEEYIDALAEMGFRRVSVGIQSFDDEELKLVRRKTDLSPLERHLGQLRALGIDVNLDLIYGLPSQTETSVLGNLRRAIELEPYNITLYPLAIRELTLLYDKLDHMCVPMSEKYRFYDLITEELERAGYHGETVVRYVKGERSTYQQQKLEFSGVETLGLGAGARSYSSDVHYAMPYRMGEKIARSIVERFLECEDFDQLGYEGFVFDEDEKKRQFVVLNLLGSGVDGGLYADRFGETVTESFGVELEALDTNGLLDHDPSTDVYRLSKSGRKYSDISGHVFFSERVLEREATCTLS